MAFRHPRPHAEKPSGIAPEIAPFLYDAIGQAITDKLSIRTMESQIHHAFSTMIHNYQTSGSKSLRTLTDWTKPSYQLAYIYIYFVMHACVTYHVAETEMCAFLPDDLSRRDSINVCSIGGGPGSDVAGLLFFLHIHYPNCRQLKVIVCDIYPEWSYAWKAVLNHLPKDLRAKVKVTYVHFDMLKTSGPLSTPVLDAVQYADIVMFVKSLSPVDAVMFHGDRTLASTLQHIFLHLKTDAVVLSINNSGLTNRKKYVPFLTIAHDTAGLKIERQRMLTKEAAYLPPYFDISSFSTLVSDHFRPWRPMQRLDAYVAILKRHSRKDPTLAEDDIMHNPWERLEEVYDDFLPILLERWRQQDDEDKKNSTDQQAGDDSDFDVESDTECELELATAAAVYKLRRCKVCQDYGHSTQQCRESTRQHVYIR